MLKFTKRGLLTLLSVFVMGLTFAQQKSTITGVISDQDGNTLPGATVMIKGTTQGTSADFDGNYKIEAAPGQELVFSFMGFVTQTVTIQENKTVYNVSLEESVNQLDQVLVVAYGKANRESITGSVTAISSKDIEDRASTSVIAALEGSAPGIQFNANGGSPGSSGGIRIRGFTTVNGSNSPLYVIDGVPFDGNISDIDPEDVESISVLKDASASALYGNRASNGVIIIETKGAKANSGNSFKISTQQGVFRRGLPEYRRLGPNQFVEAMWQGYRNSLVTDQGMSVSDASSLASQELVQDFLISNIYDVPDNELVGTDGKINPNASILPGYRNDLNWYKGIQRTGYRQNYHISGTTSNEKGGTYYSVGYVDEKGYVKTEELRRINARLNANYKVNDWLRYGVNLSASHQKQDLSNTGDFKNPFIISRNVAPIYPVHLHDQETGEIVIGDDGKPVFDSGENTRGQYVGRHVIWENLLDSRTQWRNQFRGAAFAEVDFLKNFTFKISADMDARNQEVQRYDNAIIGDGAGNAGRDRIDVGRWHDYTFQQQLRWGRTFGRHRVDVLVGHENYNQKSSGISGAKAGETFPGIPDFDNYTNITSLTGSHDRYASESYLSQVKYNFLEKIYVDGSFRRDGTSKFARHSRWGNFWSAGASWILTKEDFLENQKWLNYLKVKASYGEVGNDTGAGLYAYQALYNLSQNGNLPSAYLLQNGAPDLKWETSTSFNVGFDAQLFNRANINLEYFDKRSKNLLFDINLPLSAGATSSGSAVAALTENLGTISNKGFELHMDVDIVQSQDWNWNVGLNATWLKNKIVSLPEQNREEGIINGTKRLVEGKSIYEFWQYHYEGVDQLTGNALYTPDDEAYNVNGSNPDADQIPDEFLVDIDGKYYTTNTSYGKRFFSGTAIPDVYGSFTTNLSWKNFSLSGLFTYSLGGKVYDSSYRSLMSMSGTPSALHKDILGAWNGVPEGITADSPNRVDPNGIPAINYSLSTLNNASNVDRWLTSGDYFSIKNITVSYEIPSDILKKISLKSGSVYFTAENLKTFTKRKGLNPQYSFAGTSGDNPVPYRILSLGLRIGL